MKPYKECKVSLSLILHVAIISQHKKTATMCNYKHLNKIITRKYMQFNALFMYLDCNVRSSHVQWHLIFQ